MKNQRYLKILNIKSLIYLMILKLKKKFLKILEELANNIFVI